MQDYVKHQTKVINLQILSLFPAIIFLDTLKYSSHDSNSISYEKEEVEKIVREPEIETHYSHKASIFIKEKLRKRFEK